MTTEHINESFPLNVWPVAQTTAQYQRSGRYLSECSAHPGKMLPSLARRIVEEFSKSGDLILDPMAGIGTTVAEGALLDRHCVGVEFESRWTEIARRNLDHMLSPDKRDLAFVTQGDARNLEAATGNLHGQVDLIVTSPPYACDLAQTKTDRESGHVTRVPETARYSTDRENLGHAQGARYADAMFTVYQSCFATLRPGGMLVTVTKNMRRGNKLLNIARITAETAERVGFAQTEHIIALLCAVRDGGLVARPSFWQQQSIRRAQRNGLRQYLVAHEDVLVFVKPKSSVSSCKLKHLQHEPRCATKQFSHMITWVQGKPAAGNS